MKYDLIYRKEIMEILISYTDTTFIKAITGIRGSGKSSIMFMLMEYLRCHKNIEDNQIISIDFESIEYFDIKDIIAFIKLITSKINKENKFYLFFDEIHEVNGWEKVVEGLRIDYDVDIYVTGSNANLLSSEFTTYISGRYVEIKVHPLSFKEFLLFYKSRILKDEVLDIKNVFNYYIKYGGLPIIFNGSFKDNNIVMNNIKSVVSIIIEKSISSIYNALNANIIRSLLKFLCEKIDVNFTINNISKAIRDYYIKNNTDTNDFIVTNNIISDYIELLIDSYIFHSVNSFDIIEKEIIEINQKYYIEDIGIRNSLISYEEDLNLNHIYENIVYNELLVRNYKVYFGKFNNHEIDFVALSCNRKIYIQFTKSLNEENAFKRVVAPLLEIKDNYPKFIIVFDYYPMDTYEGIKIYNIIDFLLKEDWI